MALPPVRKQIVVEASQTRAFRVFTAEQGAWWPLVTHHIGEKPAEAVIIEPHAGGRWFERAQDGTECLWGRVLVWDPPGRLVLLWQTGADWKHDETLMTEVEVRFVALGPARTRVELEHRGLEQFGTHAETMRGALDSEGGWTGMVKLFAAYAASASDHAG